MTMADYERFDALRDAAREHAARGDSDAAASNLGDALAAARAGFAEEPAAWIPRIGMVQMDIERSSPSDQLRAESEAATHELLAYAREGAGDDSARRDLLLRTLNAFSMQLEAEQRNGESLALAEELLGLLSTGDDPERRSELAHTRGRAAELRLSAGDAAGALELADLLVDDERRHGDDPSQRPSGLPSWLRLRARALAALGREADARADFESSLEWDRARVRTKQFLADLDLADGLEEYAALLDSMGATDDARAQSEEAQRIRAERRRR